MNDLQTTQPHAAAVRRQGSARALAFAAIVCVIQPAGQALAQSAPALSAVGINEIKAGAFYHDAPGLWSGFRVEQPAFDANVEVLFNPWARAFGGYIRPAIGTTVNFSHGTSKAYADVRWEIEHASGFFGGLGMGAAYHNGQLGMTNPDLKALGSPVLFHPSAEVGYRFDGANSISLFADHMSNGFSRRNNEGMDTVGVRLGHRFADPGSGLSGGAADQERVARFDGPYLGAAAGYRVNEVDWGVSAPATATSRNAFGSGLVGYNWQSGHGVLGLEAEVSPTHAVTATTCTLPSSFCQLTVNRLASIRPRFGVVIDQTMIYGTGGVAIANWDAGAIATGSGAPLAAVRSTNYGVAVGAGIEHKFGENLSLRAEVMHYGLRGDGLPTAAGTSLANQFQSTSGRVGFAWYFR